MTMLSGEPLVQRARLALDIPLTAALGIRLIDGDDPTAGVQLTVAGLADNGVGGAHAAALSAALEVAAYLALLPQLAVDEHAVTVSSALHLLAPAPAGGDVRVTAAADPRTRRLACITAHAVCDGVTVARAQLTKAVVPLRAG